ncbi:MAG: hypothetical protein C7B45_05015 [Sulfobacillus acidophilus]|uniref:SWIM-type domain-containing protein n=1 Tax=Sulfobacillus acidophilus TaxID=53633 RepID=A0A2T2WKS5_9FIRM|nr:MAG: hypothetical protein C7B45_05015 [Sulfobacillus acidophilus]
MDKASVHAWLDTVPRPLRHHAQDYLTEDRLARRLRRGSTLYTAELRGYRDRYWPRATIEGGVWAVTCTCDRRPKLCAHAVALMLDLSRFSADYAEAPWKLVVQADRLIADWPFESPLTWHLIPVTTPFWRKPQAEDFLPTLVSLLQTAANLHLAEDPSLPIWAELHPSWLNHAAIQHLWTDWLRQYQSPRAQDAPLWVRLHWMQPVLKLTSVFLALDTSAAASAIFRQLWSPQPLIVPTPKRQRALLADLTLVHPELAALVWPFFRGTDPFALAQADALYLAGRQHEAIQRLEQDLPDDAAARKQVRLRLIEWLDLNDSVPHRLALAWESGSLTYAEPIHHLLSDAQWTRLTDALRLRHACEPSADDSE